MLKVTTSTCTLWNVNKVHLANHQPRCRQGRVGSTTCVAKGTNARKRAQMPFRQELKAQAPKRVRHSADAQLVDRLQGISLGFVGDNTQLNCEVAEHTAKLLEYVPLATPRIIQQLTGQSPDDIVEAEGLAALGGAEVVVLGSLSTQIRSCIATCGSGGGAAARGDCWRYLFGFITIWLDDTWQKDSDAPQREAYEQAEIRVVIAKDDSEVMTVPQVAQALLEQILQRVTELVRKDEDLCGKKGVYMKFGCRGDWPDLQPPDAKASVQGSAVSGAE
ncbi:hypothetical protein ABBQ32_008971 [Trebouxia sp. C0010 RCD-2024]